MSDQQQHEGGPAWHALSAEQVLGRQGVASTTGLSGDEVQVRRGNVGPNTLAEEPPVPAWKRLAAQFQDLVVWILIVAAIISGLLEEWVDTAAILAIVIVNGIIGYVQEARAERALASLQKLSAPLAKVLLGGQLVGVPAADLVPGDIIELEAGDNVPADARLLEAFSLRVQEAALTGESEAVFKRADLVLEPATPMLERQNCLFQGTEVVRGRGVAVVTSTGMATELGQIATLINTAGGESTPLQERLDGLAKVLVGTSLALVAVVVGLGLLLGQDPLNLLEVSLSMAVAIVPEGLPAVITVTLAIGTQRMVQRAALIRRLPAVEALGSVTVICSDKTGTLTQNRQVVQELRFGNQSVLVGGHGY